MTQVQGIMSPARQITLSANELAWVEFIRMISNGTDPGVTLSRIQALRRLFG